LSYMPFQFAEASSSGISSLGLNLKGFLFQWVTLLIVLAILWRYAFPKLIATLEARRKTLEESLAQAKQTEEALERAEVKVEELLARARVQADAAIAEAKVRAEEIIAAGEHAASERGIRIIKDAEAKLGQERERLHSQLRKELAELVVAATEKVLRKKINEREDRALIEQSLKELG
jgi:F-type H+-transporting ATPase subunit b